ncbi:MAG: helix-turn-helix domain-containing protein [Emcibacter sp.]|nr:helix-turn-helix domain-containing protein [Emcibacter sp.]
MDVENRQATEEDSPTDDKVFAVSLADIELLLGMTDIGPSAETFHQYAKDKKGDRENQTMSLSSYFRILWELSVVLQDETIHLSSRHLMPGSTSYIMSNISSCDNLEDAMRLIAKSYNILHGGPYNRVEIRDGFLLYIIDDSQFPYMVKNEDYIHFTMECVLIYLQGILSFSTSQDLLPLLHKVYTKRKRGPMKSRHMSYWNVPVRYQSGQYALIYDLSAATLPITIDQLHMPSSWEIYDHVIAMIARTSPEEEKRNLAVTERVRLALEQGMIDQQKIARHLGYSVATLRRRLSLENTTFRQINNRALNEKAKLLMAQGIHINDVADELGFSDFRSFIRAFKNWNDITPTVYVKNLK